VVKKDGSLWGFGDNSTGALPVQVGAISGVAASIETGGWHSLAVTGDGRLYAWGWNGVGQLGLGSTSNQYSPVEVPGLTAVAAAAGGQAYTLVRKTEACGSGDWTSTVSWVTERETVPW
jgi:hypothetical protein